MTPALRSGERMIVPATSVRRNLRLIGGEYENVSRKERTEADLKAVR